MGERERERENTVLDHVMYNYKSIIVLYPKTSCYIIIWKTVFILRRLCL